MNKIAVFIYQTLLIFVCLGALFIPFSFRSWNFQHQLTRFLFEDILLLVANQFEGVIVVNQSISSDSVTLYVLFFVLLLIAFLLNATLSFFNYWKTHQDTIFNSIQLFLTYYLALILLKYGFDKIFKAQFYLPEPNTLYTPLGLLDKDILYWSTLGVSHSYNICIGLFEVIPALLLLHKKTRIIGLMLLSGVLINIVFINFGFDISVKLFSLFLLLVNLLLLAPSAKRIIQFFVLNKPTSLPYLTGEQFINSTAFRLSIKTAIVLILFTESLLPYLISGQFNDDNVLRNKFHGAYEIETIETGSANENKTDFNIKRFFIHRHHYFIFQFDDDRMEDYYLDIIPNKNQFRLTNYDGETFTLEYNYSEKLKRLEIKSTDFNWTLHSKALPWKNLPLLQPLFHWTVDSVAE